MYNTEIRYCILIMKFYEFCLYVELIGLPAKKFADTTNHVIRVLLA